VHRVRYNNAYNVIRREFPSDVGEARYATITITETDGSALKTVTETTIWGVKSKIAVVTLTNAVEVGDYTAVLTLGTETTSLYPGDTLRIGGGTGATDTLTVQTYNASTYTVTFTDWFKSAHAVGEYVVGRWTSYTLDTTTVATWTSGLRFTTEWAFSLVAGSPLAATRTWSATDEGEIEKRSYGSGDLESHFRARYRRYYDAIEQGDFSLWESDARQEVSDMFEQRDKNINRLVDSERLDGLLMAQIAMSMAYAQGDDWEAERAAMTRRRDDLFALLAALPFWTDDDQDLVEDEFETQKAERPLPRRRLF
jgi:hypothetical protein